MCRVCEALEGEAPAEPFGVIARSAATKQSPSPRVIARSAATKQSPWYPDACFSVHREVRPPQRATTRSHGVDVPLTQEISEKT